MHSLLDISSLSQHDIATIFEYAASYQKKKRDDILQGKDLVIAFFESSTRTRSSFDLAVRRLGGNTIYFDSQGSSIAKGESFIDTIHTLNQYDVHGWIIRHGYAYAPQILQQETQSIVINAGDGSHQHPTQALLDAYTLYSKWGSIDGKKIMIVGDVMHSRVARSNIQLLSMLGAKVFVSGPGTLLPRNLPNVSIVPTIHDAIHEMDAIIMLRIQLERMKSGLIPSKREYTRYFSINEKMIAKHKELLILHPGPANYGLELSMECMRYKNVLIREQVKNGLYIRMAVLKHCFS
ncbi:aspartate carbamoyltransferase [Chlorobiota bacterium]|nr:aspartate carbamoyltransferase [Chlorobiota bacterium]